MFARIIHHAEKVGVCILRSLLVLRDPQAALGRRPNSNALPYGDNSIGWCNEAPEDKLISCAYIKRVTNANF